MRSWFAAGVLICALCSGCLSATQRREDDLIKEAREFNDDLRWARWESMVTSMPGEDKQPFMSRVDLAGKDLVMGDFEVKSIRFDGGSQAATVSVDLEWYKKSDPTVRSTSLEQRWETRGGGRWLMVKQRRARGDRFPLVTEPVGKPASPPKAATPPAADEPEVTSTVK
jgi:hypothetical protein